MKVIYLTQNKSTIVDDSDYLSLSKYKWFFQRNHKDRLGGYAARKEKGQTLYMHRFILDAPDNLQVDHINRNCLDNRKLNLRLCTRQENSRNSKLYANNQSGYKGVWFNKIIGKFGARLYINHKAIHGGYYNSSKEAAKVYNNLAMFHYQKFARLNQI